MNTLELTLDQARLLSRAIGDRLDNLSRDGCLVEFHELYKLDCIIDDMLKDSDDWEAEEEAEREEYLAAEATRQNELARTETSHC